MADAELLKAIVHAHRAAECGDYYCGCWDRPRPEDNRYPSHTDIFIAVLRREGYEIVKTDG